MFQARLTGLLKPVLASEEQSRGTYDLKIGRVGLKNDILCQAKAATLAAHPSLLIDVGLFGQDLGMRNERCFLYGIVCRLRCQQAFL
jgi:hypothetical protein